MLDVFLLWCCACGTEFPPRRQKPSYPKDHHPAAIMEQITSLMAAAEYWLQLSIYGALGVCTTPWSTRTTYSQTSSASLRGATRAGRL